VKFSGVLCFTYMSACNIALSNKLAAYDMNMSYCASALSEYYYSVVLNTFPMLAVEEDIKSASRYHEALQCRMVSHTLMKKTLQGLMMTGDRKSAQLVTMQYMTYNALHTSMIPLLHLHLIQRLVRIDILFLVVIICEELGVPLIPLPSLQQFLNNEEVSNIRHKKAITDFFNRCHIEGLFQPQDARYKV
jgi:hypothetical protein